MCPRARWSGGGVHGGEDDLGDEAGVGDHRQVRGARDDGDAGVCLPGHGEQFGRRDGVVAGADDGQDGMVAQAGTPDGWVSAIVDSGRWVAASTAVWSGGRPPAMHEPNALWLM